MTSKNNVLTYILTYLCQKPGRVGSLNNPPSLPPLGFTAITDHPRLLESEAKSGVDLDTVFLGPGSIRLKARTHQQQFFGPVLACLKKDSPYPLYYVRRMTFEFGYLVKYESVFEKA
jgi:hypothetical protein